jgi:hypothetical protein
MAKGWHSKTENKTMATSVYTTTATKAKTKTGSIFAFGREDALAGKPVSEGGYSVWKKSPQQRGGAMTWGYVKLNMSHADAIAFMNKRVHHKAFA